MESLSPSRPPGGSTTDAFTYEGASASDRDICRSHADADGSSADRRPGGRFERQHDTASRGTVAKNVNGKMTSKIVGTASDGSKVTGNFTPLRFLKKDGKQQVKGVVDGVVTHADGTKETFTALRTVKVKSINGKSLSGLARSSARALRPATSCTWCWGRSTSTCWVCRSTSTRSCSTSSPSPGRATC